MSYLWLFFPVTSFEQFGHILQIQVLTIKRVMPLQVFLRILLLKIGKNDRDCNKETSLQSQTFPRKLVRKNTWFSRSHDLVVVSILCLIVQCC